MLYCQSMKSFNVTYRGGDGKQCVVRIAADDRKGVFDELARRGISAIRVEECTGKSKASLPAKPSYLKGLAAGAVVVVLAVATWMMLAPGDAAGTFAGENKSPRKTAPAKPAVDAPSPRPADESRPPATAASVAQEYNDTVKEFVKKAATNNVVWIVPPLDPDDPDNALRTRVAQELGSLLSIEPGEPMPPFPYSFLMEDDMKEAASRGEDVGEIDNGNKTFLESLKKWKIAAKENDDDHRLEHKEKLLQAQQELIDGMNEGVSVNDSIRAAYEFRKQAFEFRSTIVNTLTEMAAEGDPPEKTIEMLRDVNKQLAKEGIKTIPVVEILPDYEVDESRETVEP